MSHQTEGEHLQEASSELTGTWINIDEIDHFIARMLTPDQRAALRDVHIGDLILVRKPATVFLLRVEQLRGESNDLARFIGVKQIYHAKHYRPSRVRALRARMQNNHSKDQYTTVAGLQHR